MTKYITLRACYLTQNLNSKKLSENQNLEYGKNYMAKIESRKS